jgi:hypothetical protein
LLTFSRARQKKVWASFTEDMEATWNVDISGQTMLLEKIPIMGGMVTWFLATMLALSMLGRCCCQAQV